MVEERFNKINLSMNQNWIFGFLCTIFIVASQIFGASLEQAIREVYKNVDIEGKPKIGQSIFFEGKVESINLTMNLNEFELQFVNFSSDQTKLNGILKCGIFGIELDGETFFTLTGDKQKIMLHDMKKNSADTTTATGGTGTTKAATSTSKNKKSTVKAPEQINKVSKNLILSMGVSYTFTGKVISVASSEIVPRW